VPVVFPPPRRQGTPSREIIRSYHLLKVGFTRLATHNRLVPAGGWDNVGHDHPCLPVSVTSPVCACLEGVVPPKPCHTVLLSRFMLVAFGAEFGRSRYPMVSMPCDYCPSVGPDCHSTTHTVSSDTPGTPRSVCSLVLVPSLR
jgi:hypothetical protein